MYVTSDIDLIVNDVLGSDRFRTIEFCVYSIGSYEEVLLNLSIVKFDAKRYIGMEAVEAGLGSSPFEENNERKSFIYTNMLGEKIAAGFTNRSCWVIRNGKIEMVAGVCTLTSFLKMVDEFDWDGYEALKTRKAGAVTLKDVASCSKFHKLKLVE